MAVQAPKGTKDVTPQESYKWQYVEAIARDVCRKYGINETRTPVFEHTELFLRGVGDTTDIVQKEMYTFDDKGGRSMTLKPEGTAGAVRMMIENKLFNEAQPTKMYYLSAPVFRYERPQAGRLREHHQFGIEIFGAPKASTEAELIAIALEMISRVGIKGLSVNINSIGCEKCRPVYNEKLREYFKGHIDELCTTCHTRLEKNPLRILDCKEEKCKEVAKGAPVILDCLCDECKEHFEQLKGYLTAMNIEFKVDPHIVRGLDYYTKTVFEIISNHIGSQGTVCGGGRYDNLVEQLGGPKMNGVGFGMGIERLLLVAESQGVEIPKNENIDVYVVTMGDNTEIAGFKLAYELRKKGLSVEFDNVGRSVKAQFKYAGKINAKYVAVIGEEELANGQAKIKNMENGEEQLVEFDKIADYLRGK